jgi:hypothetical protein
VNADVPAWRSSGARVAIEDCPMNLLGYYPHLEGSEGKVRVRLDQAMLDQLCGLIRNRFKDRIEGLRITPIGDNRFRIQAELSNWFLQLAGSIGLRSLREDGIEVQILFPSASRKNPTIEGSMDTTVLGRDFAIPKLIEAINEGLGAGEAIEVTESEWLGGLTLRVFVSVHPFRLLRKFLPAGIGHHVTRVKWQASEDAFLFDFTWHHSGAKKPIHAPNEEKKNG